jgi:hypothetical protein
MLIEKQEKQAWQTPEIIDLDIDKTETGMTPAGTESTLSSNS